MSHAFYSENKYPQCLIGICTLCLQIRWLCYSTILYFTSYYAQSPTHCGRGLGTRPQNGTLFGFKFTFRFWLSLLAGGELYLSWEKCTIATSTTTDAIQCTCKTFPTTFLLKSLHRYILCFFVHYVPVPTATDYNMHTVAD